MNFNEFLSELPVQRSLCYCGGGGGGGGGGSGGSPGPSGNSGPSSWFPSGPSSNSGPSSWFSPTPAGFTTPWNPQGSAPGGPGDMGPGSWFGPSRGSQGPSSDSSNWFEPSRGGPQGPSFGPSSWFSPTKAGFTTPWNPLGSAPGGEGDVGPGSWFSSRLGGYYPEAGPNDIPGIGSGIQSLIGREGSKGLATFLGFDNQGDRKIPFDYFNVVPAVESFISSGKEGPSDGSGGWFSPTKAGFTTPWNPQGSAPGGPGDMGPGSWFGPSKGAQGPVEGLSTWWNGLDSKVDSERQRLSNEPQTFLFPSGTMVLDPSAPSPSGIGTNRDWQWMRDLFGGQRLDTTPLGLPSNRTKEEMGRDTFLQLGGLFAGAAAPAIAPTFSASSGIFGIPGLGNMATATPGLVAPAVAATKFIIPGAMPWIWGGLAAAGATILTGVGVDQKWFGKPSGVGGPGAFGGSGTGTAKWSLVPPSGVGPGAFGGSGTGTAKWSLVPPSEAVGTTPLSNNEPSWSQLMQNPTGEVPPGSPFTPAYTGPSEGKTTFTLREQGFRQDSTGKWFIPKTVEQFYDDRWLMEKGYIININGQWVPNKDMVNTDMGRDLYNWGRLEAWGGMGPVTVLPMGDLGGQAISKNAWSLFNTFLRTPEAQKGLMGDKYVVGDVEGNFKWIQANVRAPAEVEAADYNWANRATSIGLPLYRANPAAVAPANLPSARYTSIDPLTGESQISTLGSTLLQAGMDSLPNSFNYGQFPHYHTQSELGKIAKAGGEKEFTNPTPIWPTETYSFRPRGSSRNGEPLQTKFTMPLIPVPGKPGHFYTEGDFQATLPGTNCAGGLCSGAGGVPIDPSTNQPYPYAAGGSQAGKQSPPVVPPQASPQVVAPVVVSPFSSSTVGQSQGVYRGVTLNNIKPLTSDADIKATQAAGRLAVIFQSSPDCPNCPTNIGVLDKIAGGTKGVDYYYVSAPGSGIGIPKDGSLLSTYYKFPNKAGGAYALRPDGSVIPNTDIGSLEPTITSFSDSWGPLNPSGITRSEARSGLTFASEGQGSRGLFSSLGSAITGSVGDSSSIRVSRVTPGDNNFSPGVRKEVRVIGGV